WNLLNQILRVNGFGIVKEGEIYRVVPLAEVVRHPIQFVTNASSRDIPDDDQLILNMVYLKFMTVDELTKILQEFTDPNAIIKSYGPANALFTLTSRRNMRRVMDLIAMFDSDTFTNQRVRLFQVENARPSDLVKQLENIVKSISLDS